MGTVAARAIGSFTGEILGDRMVFDGLADARQTSFIHSGVDNYVVCSVLPQWNETLSSSVIDPIFEGARTVARTAASQVERVFRFDSDCLIERSAMLLTSSPIEATTVSAYDAVRYAEKTLGIPVTDITKSCGISRRTFYSWQKPGIRQPRLASEGRLWLLVQMIEDLVSILGVGSAVSRWIREDPSRRSLLVSGEYDELFSTLMSERSKVNEGMYPMATGPMSSQDAEIRLPRTADRRIPERTQKAKRRSARRAVSNSGPSIPENS